MMVGQKNILQKLSSYNIDTFPRSILIVGEEGMGKHTLAYYIKDQVIKYLPLIDISKNISYEYIDEIYRNPNPAIYLIDCSELTEKDQNTMLKFIEEPLNNSFIIVLANSKNLLLNTVINRCITFELEPYSDLELDQFVMDAENKDLLLKMVRSPGRLKMINSKTISGMLDIIEKISTKIQNASYSNTLSITSKVNLKDEYDKFDIFLFMDTLTQSLFSHYIKDNNVITLNMYKLTENYRKKLIDKRINRAYFMDNFLTELWLTARGKS